MLRSSVKIKSAFEIVPKGEFEGIHIFGKYPVLFL